MATSLSCVLIHILLAVIRCYQRYISPLLIGHRCRFCPTCSNYACQALLQYGFLRGSWLTIKRLLRCHPLTVGGYDPIPSQTDNNK